MMPFRLSRSRCIGILVVSLVIGLVILWLPGGAYLRGMGMAYLNHLSGYYEIKAAGKHGPDVEYPILLRERYGVNIKRYDCLVSSQLHSYIAGYNSASERLLIGKYKRDIFEECWIMAEKMRQEKQAKTKRS
jgi:hypothetical protein